MSVLPQLLRVSILFTYFKAVKDSLKIPFMTAGAETGRVLKNAGT